jgi:orotidine-5'-phosphate decarboxylase
MSPFPERLAAAVADAGAPLCVGLDPDPPRLPSSLRGQGEAAAVLAFCLAITESTWQHAAAFKPNLAFFEALGPDGWHVLDRVAAAVRETGRLLVLDAKRGDIGNTGRLYAEALYGRYGADAVTVSPYMGADSIAPFLGTPGRCAFVLVATSNPGAPALQDLVADGRPLSAHAAALAHLAAEDLPGTPGFVVGASRPDALAALRADYPGTPFLVPGVGAQGGDLAAVLAANAGGPILINASRSILYASSDEDFAAAAATVAAALVAEMRAEL